MDRKLDKPFHEYLADEVLAKSALTQEVPGWVPPWVGSTGFPPWQYVARVLANIILERENNDTSAR